MEIVSGGLLDVEAKVDGNVGKHIWKDETIDMTEEAKFKFEKMQDQGYDIHWRNLLIFTLNFSLSWNATFFKDDSYRNRNLNTLILNDEMVSK